MNQTATTKDGAALASLIIVRQRSHGLAHALREAERGGTVDLEHVYADVVEIRQAAARVGAILFELSGVPEEPTW